MGPEPRSRLLLGSRAGVIVALILAGLASAGALGLELDGLLPRSGGLELAGRFAARALSPALYSEAGYVPPGTPPLLVLAAEAAGTTFVFAAAAMALSIVLGTVLGFLASTAWWADDPAGGRTALGRLARTAVLPAVYGATRALIAFMRSIHELLWAVLLLAAFGLTETAALIAIAIPYGGTLAKIYSELIDEAPRGAARALRDAGAGGVRAFVLGLVPHAMPDMIAYTFYRFECSLRASAVLGFFGFPTLGLYLRQSFHSAHYGEVWTYLYVLLAMIALFDAWSGALRRRLVS